MRIMLVHAPSPIARELHRRGHDILSCNPTQRPQPDGVYSDASSTDDGRGPVPSCRFEGERKISWSAIRNVARQVIRYRPDVLHAFTPASLAWCVLGTSGMSRRPKLLSFRGIPRLLRHSDPSEWISYLSPRVTVHACESNAVMHSLLRSGISPDRCRVTYNTAWDFDVSRSAESWRTEWGVDPREIVIGTVAHVRPVKGIDVLLRAAVGLRELHRWKLVIIGKMDDPQVRTLSQAAELQERIRFTGHLDDAPSAMQAFDLFIMPSRSEGLCRALIEAMTLAICPIVSSAGGMKELVRHEQDGLVFPVDDHAKLESAIMSLSMNPELRHRFAQSASRRVRTMCSPQAVVDKLEELYTYVMERDWSDDFG